MDPLIFRVVDDDGGGGTGCEGGGKEVLLLLPAKSRLNDFCLRMERCGLGILLLPLPLPLVPPLWGPIVLVPGLSAVQGVPLPPLLLVMVVLVKVVAVWVDREWPSAVCAVTIPWP